MRQRQTVQNETKKPKIISLYLLIIKKNTLIKRLSNILSKDFISVVFSYKLLVFWKKNYFVALNMIYKVCKHLARTHCSWFYCLNSFVKFILFGSSFISVAFLCRGYGNIFKQEIWQEIVKLKKEILMSVNWYLKIFLEITIFGRKEKYI